MNFFESLKKKSVQPRSKKPEITHRKNLFCFLLSYIGLLNES